jgi:hypothetical protein
LILKTLVGKQASYFAGCHARKDHGLGPELCPAYSWVNRCGRRPPDFEGISVGLLNELQVLPTKVADPHWLETLEKGEADSSKDV